MANKFAPNFPIPSSTNMFQCIWKLTRIMKAAGWTYMASSDGTNKDTTGTASNDKWGGNADPTLDTYPVNNLSDSSAGWIVLRGPSTVKIPLSAAPTGTFLRGETITQATSAAEGELIGYVWDSVGLSGWAVVAPRVGTFDNSHTVTGSTSGATFVPTGTVVTYVREFVFAKTTSNPTNNGMIFYICADVSGESAQLFSTLATAAGCTATVAPGSGGTGNAFPTKGIVIRGNSNSSPTDWVGATSAYQNNAQIACVNATAATGVTADGSFYLAMSYTSTVNTALGFMFTRLDDTDPGDVDPYVFYGQGGFQNTNYANTANFSNSSNAYICITNIVNATFYNFFGYQSRGNTVTARDTPCAFRASLIYSPNTQFFMQAQASLTTYPTQICTPATTKPVAREPVSVWAHGSITNLANVVPHWKGRCRWLHTTPIGNVYDTFDNKTWLCVSYASLGSNNNPAVVFGPYDGSTTPIQ